MWIADSLSFFNASKLLLGNQTLPSSSCNQLKLKVTRKNSEWPRACPIHDVAPAY